MNKSKIILYFGIIQWEDIKQRPQHLAEGLSENYFVYYFNPGMGFKQFISNFITKNWGNISFQKQINKNLIVFDPIISIPFNKDIKILNKIHGLLLRLFVKFLIEFCDISPTILWFSFPDQIEVLNLKLGNHPLKCYDCMDEYSNYRERKNPNHEANEKKMLKKVDLVFTTSSLLLEKCVQLNQNSFLIENGVEFEHFNKVLTLNKSDLVLNKGSNTIIGFFGTIGEWIDLDLLDFLATKRPEWIFIIIGPVEIDVSRFNNRENVKFFGRIDYKLLPMYLISFNVCLILFKINTLTNSVNPVKLFEYAAVGKPIVTTNIFELRKYSEICMISKDYQEFLNNIETGLSENDNELVNKRIVFALENTWRTRVNLISRHLEKEIKTENDPI
jgi:glycosyltransferase involved in cell wall biosynthesis